MLPQTLYLCGTILPNQIWQLHGGELALDDIPIDPGALHDKVQIFADATGTFECGQPLTVTFVPRCTDITQRARLVIELRREHNRLHATITYSSKNPLDWRRTAMAYGLAYLLCGRLEPGETLTIARFRPRRDPEVDQFVMDYLLPRECVHAALDSQSSVGRLARQFGVTPSIMRLRLRQIGRVPRRRAL